jgi:hypothetical protein
VVAVFEPPGFRNAPGDSNDPGGWFFDESLSQSGKREIIENAEFFDRFDARIARISESSPETSEQETTQLENQES